MARSKVKILLGTCGVLIALIALLLVVAIFHLGGVVKTAAETLGPRVTGTTVTLEQAKVRPLRGFASLEGLVVGNPPGYDAPHAVALKQLKVELEPRSLLTDSILIHSVLIDGPEITLEGSLKDNNLTHIKDHATASSKKPETGTPAKPESGKKAPAKHVVIEKLEIRGCKLHYGTMLEVPVSDITLTDIGKGEPMTMERAIALVLDKVLSSSLGAFGASNDILTKGFKGFGRSAEKSVNASVDAVAKDAAAGDTGAAAEDVKKVGGALESLFLKSGKQEKSSE